MESMASSKIVTDLEKRSTALIAATQVNTDDVAAAMAAALTPALAEGQVPIDAAELQRQLGALVEHLRSRLVDADEETQVGRVEEAELRARRNAAKVEVRKKLVALRGTMEGVFGPEGVELLGIGGEVSQDPVVLRRQARWAVRRLRAQGLEELTARLAGVEVTVETLVADLEPPLADLTAALLGLALLRRATQKALVAKASALETHGSTLVQVARMLEALYELAGFPGLASRVRPVSRRPGRAPADGEEPEEGSEVPPPAEEPPAVEASPTSAVSPVAEELPAGTPVSAETAG